MSMAWMVPLGEVLGTQTHNQGSEVIQNNRFCFLLCVCDMQVLGSVCLTVCESIREIAHEHRCNKMHTKAI